MKQLPFRLAPVMPLSMLLMCCGPRTAGQGEVAAARSSPLNTSQGPSASECATQEVEHNDPAERERAAQRVQWRCEQQARTQGSVTIKVLGLNDFHGHLAEGAKVGGRPVGGAAVLASYLKAAAAGKEDRTLIVHAGDHVGASPPESALLQDEPSIQFLNVLANSDCERTHGRDPHCNVVGTLGNHEFDEGKAELLRLLNGGNYATGPFLQNPYPGAEFEYVNSNVFLGRSNNHLITPYVVRELAGVRLGVIGAVLKETPTAVTPSGVADLSFRDEADSINAQVKQLKRIGIETIIVTIHQGSAQTPTYAGPTDATATVGSPISDIVARLDDSVDLVISGHSHSFTNALYPNKRGHTILVTQAYSYGTAYDDIDLEIDRGRGDVLAKSARIVTTYSDVSPGKTRDAATQAIVDAAVSTVAPRVNRVVTRTSGDITRAQTSAGESALGDLIADSQRAAMRTDFAFVNPGGLRADLTYSATASNPADTDGTILWGELFTVEPFRNALVKIDMTGQQIVDVLNQQWQPSATRLLQVSGLSYTWDNARSMGNRVVSVRKGGTAIDPASVYSVTVNNFLAEGGDGFTVFTQSKRQVSGVTDLDALTTYLGAQPQPIAAPSLNRITRLN